MQPSVLRLQDMLRHRLLEQRIVFLGSVVDDALANRVRAELLLLAAEDPDRDIYLYINSPGGSVYAGMAVYDVMQYVKNDIVTMAIGFAASTGQFLLCAGTAGKRYALPCATAVMHQPHGGLSGTETDISNRGGADALHEEDDGTAHRLAHRPDVKTNSD